LDKVTTINCYHAQQFAGWVEKLRLPGRQRQLPVDNCMIVFALASAMVTAISTKISDYDGSRGGGKIA
jgi:hypothetical protein